MSKRSLILLLALALFISAGAFLLLKIRKAEVSSASTPQRPVYVVEGALVKKGEIRVEDRFLGLLKPLNVIEISTKFTGYIKRILVKEGQKVRKGDLLILIEDTSLKTQIETIRLEMESLKAQIDSLRDKAEALKVDLETKRKIYERNERLFEKRAISRERLERSYAMLKLTEARYREAVSRVEALRSKLEQLRKRITALERDMSYLSIRAPANGIVRKVNFREGNLALPGKPLILLEETGKYEVVVKVPHRYPVRRGDSMLIVFNGKSVKLKVAEILPSASPENLKVVKGFIYRKPKNVVSDSLHEVIFLRKVSGYVVPADAILNMTEGNYLLVYRDGVFEKVKVKLVATDGKLAVVEGDVKEGMKVAVASQSKLRLLAFSGKGRLLLRETER